MVAPMKAPAANAPKTAGPRQPPRQRASASVGVATVATTTVAAAARAVRVFLITVTSEGLRVTKKRGRDGTGSARVAGQAWHGALPPHQPSWGRSAFAVRQASRDA